MGNSDAGIVPKKKQIMMIKCRKRNGSRLLVLRMKKNLKMPLMNPTTKPKNGVLVLEKKKKKGAMKKLAKQMRKLIEIVIQYEDQDGRILSDPFMKLPSRKELPDYYEVIRKPVDITKILTKIDDGK